MVRAEQVDLSSLQFWLAPEEERDLAFAALRRDRPIAFFKEPEFGTAPPGPGFWALTRYEDIRAASRDPELFISGRGVNIGDTPAELTEFLGSILTMDAPRHTKLRGLVSRGFTPRTVKGLEMAVRARTRKVIEKASALGECDFVSEIAAPIPLEVICDIMGIPEQDRARILDLTNVISGIGDPEYVATLDDLFSAALELYELAMRLGEERLSNPQDDITTQLMHAEVEGERLSSQEFGSFFIILVAAGNETTRNALSHGIKALSDFPDQKRLWMSDFHTLAPTAVEEILRWATPVMSFRRTLSRDVEFGGVRMREGDKVVMWYNSANRDEAKFDDPYRFDLSREPNDHVSFGAGGPHFCLGAHLARLEIRVVFEELFRVLPDIEVTGPPERLQSAFINGIKRMPVAFSAR